MTDGQGSSPQPGDEPKKATAKKPARKTAAETTASRTGAGTRKSSAGKTAAAKKTAARKTAPKSAATTRAKNGTRPADYEALREESTASTAEREQHTGRSAPKSEAAEKEGFFESREWGPILTRLAFMIGYAIVAWVTISIGFALTAIHVIVSILNGKPHRQLGRITEGIGAYLAEIFAFLSYRSDTKPFPLEGEFPIPDEESDKD